MTNQPKTISDTVRALLTVAATRGDYLVRPPKLPIASARQVVRSLFIGRLVEEVRRRSRRWPALGAPAMAARC
jgi:hypothetical protein